ncbi:hypothetical protein NEF87_002382 [Candidatus Lokiarchaeum ossiferum]|uniref:site-specific DNA-methyltransferase (adenine-specific) n=1 Tax=Candidatus Lokiarchaeum ossiferum TaxID=2951803 RepID=A0ABY6HRF3_9ARCH|nr:hypothetical protein NEF87_002382 [Candidatus Lokiarchaeum sp. B-35]
MLESLWAIFQSSSDSKSRVSKQEQLRLMLNIFMVLKESKSREYLVRSLDGGSHIQNDPPSISPLSALRHNVLQQFSIQSAKISFVNGIESFSEYSSKLLKNLIDHLRPCVNDSTFLSRLYESYVSFKHQRGTFYTPPWMIDYILTILSQKWNKQAKTDSLSSPSIADISCGTGNFLQKIPAFFSEANISGVDIDPLALEIAYLNLKLFSAKVQKSKSPFTNHFYARDSLRSTVPNSPFNIVCGNPPWGTTIDSYQKLLKTHYHALIRSVTESQEFIGGKSPTSPMKRPYKIRDQLDIYSLFVVRNLKILKKGGLLALIIPSTILFNPVYEPLRRFLLKTTTILQISYLGENVFVDVNVPSIILFLKKIPAASNHNVIISHLLDQKPGSQMDSDYFPQWSSDEIPQQTFLQHPFCNFTIFTAQATLNIVQQVEDTPHYVFGDFVSNSRGVEIGKVGKIYQCPFCKKWNPISHFKKSIKLNSAVGAKCNQCKEFVYKKQMIEQAMIIRPTNNIPITDNKSKWVPLLRGEDIHRYKLKSEFSIKLGYDGIKYKHPDKFRSPKILLRKTGKGIIGALDYNNFYTLQVIYQFSLKYTLSSSSLQVSDSASTINYEKGNVNDYSPELLRKYSIEFLFGIISSKLIELYYHNNFANPKKKTFPHLIQANVLALPIPKIDFSNSQNPSYTLYLKIEECIRKIISLRENRFEDEELIQTLILEKDDAVETLFTIRKNIN